MGLLEKLLGKSAKDFPELGSDHPARTAIETIKPELSKLVSETDDNLELIPMENEAYVYLGKPPKEFGLTWIMNNRLYNFKSLLEESGVSEVVLQKLATKLRNAYEEHSSEEKYHMNFEGKDIIVAPSEAFGMKVKSIIAEVVTG